MLPPLPLLYAQTGTYEFPNARTAMASPLAKKLFGVDGISSVFFGSDFITITKQGDQWNWNALKPHVFAAMSDYFSSGEPLFYDKETLANSDTAIQPEDDEVGLGGVRLKLNACITSGLTSAFVVVLRSPHIYLTSHRPPTHPPTHLTHTLMRGSITN